jgi:hypothetical protein
VAFFSVDESDQAFKLTLMNQANDYQHNDTKLKISELNQCAVTCADHFLDGLFGAGRLRCVPGSPGAVLAEQERIHFLDGLFGAGRLRCVPGSPGAVLAEQERRQSCEFMPPSKKWGTVRFTSTSYSQTPD